MPYISTYDRLVRAEGVAEGREEGRQEGRLEGRRIALREVIAVGFTERFGEMPDNVRSRLESTDDETVLRRWVRQVCVAGSRREFEEGM